MLRAYKTPIFAKGQKLTQSPAHVQKHAGQETPLLYTPYLQWHHPGGEHFCNWLKPPLRTTTPTRKLYWVALRMKTRALADHL